MLYGDVDGNGVISIADATAIQKYAIDLPTGIENFNRAVADVNADNRVSILDVTCIQKYLAEYVAGYGRTGQPYEEDPVLTYCSKSAIDHLGYDNMAMIYNLISDDILPQVVSQLTTAFPTFIETDGGKAIGERIGLVVYTSEFPDSVASSRESLAYVSGFPLGTENYICMLGVNVLKHYNPSYSFEGIRYSFSKSATDFSPNSNSFLGDVTLNANGEGYTADGSRATLRDLPPGTYYVKETFVPDGCKYKLDSTVYRMTFTFNNDTNHLAVLNVKDEPEGSSGVKIIKKSSVQALTDGNALYSLSGAEFTVYKSRTDAEQKANPFMTLVTDENGVSTVSEIDLGTYYVRETKAPTGFELSNEIKELVIDAIREEPYVVEFADKPVVAPLSVLLQKRKPYFRRPVDRAT